MAPIPTRTATRTMAPTEIPGVPFCHRCGADLHPEAVGLLLGLVPGGGEAGGPCRRTLEGGAGLHRCRQPGGPT